MEDKTAQQLTPDEEWKQRIAAMIAPVTQWSARTKTPQVPEPGSSLAGDNMDGLDVEAVVWYLMCISVEHVDFAITALVKVGLVPTAYMSIVRTAYIAGVNALWVLMGKTRRERRLRALRLAAEDLKVQVAAINDFRTGEDTKAAKDQAINDLRARQDALQFIAEELDSTEDVRKMKVDQTGNVATIISESEDTKKDVDFANGLRHIWRSGSAAAHAQHHYGHSRIGRDNVVGKEGGKHVVMLTGDLSKDVGPAIAGAVLTLGRVFELYDAGRVK